MSDWLVKHSFLTTEQKKVAHMAPRESGLVLGPPGCGKTQVLIQRAAYLVQSQGISAQKIRVFVYADVTEAFIRSEIKSLGFPEKMVTTFDNWCRSFYMNNVSRDLPRIYISGRVDDKKTRLAVLNALQKNITLQKKLEFVLVDDGQDLTPEVFEILSLAAQNITVFADEHQKLADEGASKSFILGILRRSKCQSFLHGDFRNSRPVAQLASRFMDEKNFRHKYLSVIRTEHKTAEVPLCYMAPSEEVELVHLSRFVRQRHAMKEKAGILVPSISLVHRVAKTLEGEGIEAEKAIPRDAQNVIHSPFDFGNNLPKITTYQMARGLTFDSVLMPQLTEAAFSKIPPSMRRRFLFMGITRASKWVYMSTVKGQEFEELTRLKPAEIEGQIRILDKILNI